MSLQEVRARLAKDPDCKSAKIVRKHGRMLVEAKLSTPYSEGAGGGNFNRTCYYDADGDKVEQGN